MDTDLFLFISGIYIFLVVIVLMVLLSVTTKGLKRLSRQIQQSVVLESLEFTPSTQNMINLAVELWRLNKRMSSFEAKLSVDEKKATINSLDRLNRFLQKNDISTADHEGKTHNEGMNIKVINVEKGHNVKHEIIGKTIKPAVSHEGVLISQAEVVIYGK